VAPSVARTVGASRTEGIVYRASVLFVHQYRSQLHLGMPHTISGAVSEIALLAHAQDLHWKEMGRLTGCPVSRQVNDAGSDVYASVFFADLQGPSDRGLSVFGPDDQVELAGGLGRYGASLLDGTHEIRLVEDAAGGAGGGGAPPLALRLSFVLVAMGAGPDTLQVSTPNNARLDQVPSLGREPDSYRLVRSAQAAGTLLPAPPNARRLWEQPYTRTYPINPDRDLNGVGLLYFANYVAFLDVAERDALQEVGGFDASLLHPGVTVRRRIAYYGNARASDRLRLTVEGWMLDGPGAARLLVQHSIHRESDGRLVALSSAERLRRAPGS
jgi:probable biosynthetic protein (TIGR04098 family)